MQPAPRRRKAVMSPSTIHRFPVTVVAAARQQVRASDYRRRSPPLRAAGAAPIRRGFLTGPGMRSSSFIGRSAWPRTTSSRHGLAEGQEMIRRWPTRRASPASSRGSSPAIGRGQNPSRSPTITVERRREARREILAEHAQRRRLRSPAGHRRRSDPPRRAPTQALERGRSWRGALAGKGVAERVTPATHRRSPGAAAVRLPLDLTPPG